MADTLYAKLNARGKKQFKARGRQSFAEDFGPYAKLGLPAHKAALDGNVECLIECFSSFKKDGVPSRDVNGATPLHLAARSNRHDVVKWLLRFTDIPVTVTAKHGETPAHVAAAQGHVESLKQILTADGKGDVKSKLATAVDKSGFSALHLAILKHRNECAKLLISELGPKAVNALNESGVTAVHLAASAGNVEVLRFLNNKNKKLLHQTDNEGASPAYYAAQEGRLEVLEFMHEKCKCDVSAACNDGLKPIHAASQCGHTNIVKYIVAQLGNQVIFDTTPDGASPLHFATSTDHLHTAQWLINSDSSGTLVNRKDGNGDTPAHDAADGGHVPMLKLLLENGADLYAINNDGNTPYSLALSGGNMDTANYVMTYASKSPQRDSGGPVKIYNMQGEVDVVEMRKSSDSPEIQLRNSSSPHHANGNTTGNKKASSSFLENTSQTLQSFTADNEQASEAKEGNGLALDMTDNELAMFNDSIPLLSNTAAEDAIVVRYSASEPSDPALIDEMPGDPGYATVKEIAMLEEKREKKKGRKISKSFLKAIKPSKGGKSKSPPPQAAGGSEMGFKPQFHSNPLMKLGGSIPPTPPPTPATAASIAPSDEALQHNLDDMEGEEDDNLYSTPDPEIVKMKSEKRQLEERNLLKSSENQKLLKDALEDLSGDESPPEIPKQNFRIEDKKIGSSNKNSSPQPDSERQKLKETDGKFPVLKSVKRDLPPMEKRATELSQIKLKRSSDWKRAEYDHPENQTSSGASDELKNILKKKVVY